MKNRGHSTTELIIRWTITTIVGVIAIALLLAIFQYGSIGLDKQYCYKLQAQAEQYSNFQLSKNNPGGFYITKDDQEMCEGIYNVKIKAVVK